MEQQEMASAVLTLLFRVKHNSVACLHPPAILVLNVELILESTRWLLKILRPWPFKRPLPATSPEAFQSCFRMAPETSMGTKVAALQPILIHILQITLYHTLSPNQTLIKTSRNTCLYMVGARARLGRRKEHAGENKARAPRRCLRLHTLCASQVAPDTR